ncbi:MAG: hypothetical protein ACOYUZ_03260 [Patescibacteria group bacterium]
MAAAILVAVSFYFQFERPFEYPYIALIGVAGVLGSVFLMAKGRLSFFDVTEKILPTVLLEMVLVFSILLIEGDIQKLIAVLLGSVAAFLSLELLFFLAFMPSRYPVHGLSRVNIAYVPFIIWYTAATSVGLIIFLHSPKWIHVLIMLVLGVTLFRTTGHPEATKEQNSRWMMIGAVVGLHLGILGAMLPLSMFAQGAIAMIVFSVMLRLRRYLYHPIPGKVQAWFEGVAATVFFGIVLITSRWL